MQKRLIRKGLVLGIILLFVGASVIPSISGNSSKINVVKDKGDLEGKRYEKEY